MLVWRRRRLGFPRFSGKLFKAGRTTRNVEVAMSGDPVKWMKRLINIFIGRKIVKRIYRR